MLLKALYSDGVAEEYEVMLFAIFVLIRFFSLLRCCRLLIGDEKDVLQAHQIHLVE